MTETYSDVLIVGGGLAGLAAAVALSSARQDVRLVERKPYIGGRAYSYLHPALETVVDSQHVLLGCCTNLIDLCRLCGADRHIRWYDEIRFLEPGTSGGEARASVIGPGVWPAPAHASMSFLTAPMLGLKDKAVIAAGLMEFLRGYPADDAEAFSTWLKRTRQTERAIRHFWEPVIVGALNDSFERCSTKYAGQVFHESFLKSAEGGRLGIPTQPLSEFYAAAAELAKRQGAAVEVRVSVETLRQEADGTWRVTCTGGRELKARQVVLAQPFEQVERLLRTLPAEQQETPAIEPLLAGFRRFTHAPITTVHVWFDRAVTELEHAALLDTRIQWVFNKTLIRRDQPRTAAEGQYLELTISESFAELQKSREEILSGAMAELTMFFPRVREAKLLRSGILKEARATFSVVPGLDSSRPPARSGMDGLYLAGDWTRTEWPSTMEGAVRSGRLAADAVCADKGITSQFLSADLAAAGAMQWIVKRS